MRALAVQAGLLALVPLLGLVPPADGAILLVPLRPDTPTVLRWAIPAGALVLGTGPFAGSVVVEGSRAALAGPALKHMTLMISAGGIGCSQPKGKEP